MKTFLVKFEATTEVEVEAVDKANAVRLARQQLDPDVDWDYHSAQEIQQEKTA